MISKKLIHFCELLCVHVNQQRSTRNATRSTHAATQHAARTHHVRTASWPSMITPHHHTQHAPHPKRTPQARNKRKLLEGRTDMRGWHLIPNSPRIPIIQQEHTIVYHYFNHHLITTNLFKH